MKASVQERIINLLTRAFLKLDAVIKLSQLRSYIFS